MPRDNWCPGCGGMYSDDEMEDSDCIYCNAGVEGVESGAEAKERRARARHETEGPDGQKLPR